MGEPAFKLYEISDALADLGEEIMEAGGEVSDEIEARLSALEGSFIEKTQRVALYVRSLTAAADAADAEAKRLKELATGRRNIADGLKRYLKSCLEVADTRRVDGNLVRVRIQKNGRPSIAWTRDFKDLPERYARVLVELNGQQAYNDWKAGNELPEGFVVDEGTHVRIE